ncbi:uncharacterized protein LOC111523464 [Piliocolobus tephrosceles]|uniref:uncharacterized protein LOC111523464 n=1 Tax=Piliocolobus tephrosceles TaxID=591936 RepID=UPI000C296F2F|nr:uncharacterized protein LOC111523464 [Piliocolobus tephrosceles]
MCGSGAQKKDLSSNDEFGCHCHIDGGRSCCWLWNHLQSSTYIRRKALFLKNNERICCWLICLTSNTKRNLSAEKETVPDGNSDLYEEKKNTINGICNHSQITRHGRNCVWAESLGNRAAWIWPPSHNPCTFHTSMARFFSNNTQCMQAVRRETPTSDRKEDLLWDESGMQGYESCDFGSVREEPTCFSWKQLSYLMQLCVLGK